MQRAPSLVRGAFAVGLVVSALGCMATDDPASEEGDGVSATVTSALTVGGHYCPQRGEIAGRNIPADGIYYYTSFGGGPDSGNMACGGYADGRGLYMADSWRYGCGAHVRLTNPRNGRWCVVLVADVGPNICVERAAGRPIIDASPVVGRELYGQSAAGWSERIPIRAELVARSTPLGCGAGSAGTPAPTPPTGGTCHSSTLGRQVGAGVCLQSRLDRVWYQCSSGGWHRDDRIPSARRSVAGACTDYVPLADARGGVEGLGPRTCLSQTLQRTVGAGFCVQSRFDREWYQCAEGAWWLDASIPSTRRGRAGACTDYVPLR